MVLLIAGGWFAVTRITSGQTKQPQYQTAQVERGTIVSTVSASGTVEVANITNITTSASGVVTQVYVKDGDTVTKGQKIADIILDTAGAQKNASAWASYLSAKNSLESAQVALLTTQSDMFSKWDGFKTLAESGTYENDDGSPRYDERAAAEFHIAENDWLAAEAKYKNQQAVIAQSQAALNSSWLSYTTSSPTITAPSNGTITNITLAAGMTISSSSSNDTNTTTGSRIAVLQYEGNPILTFNVSEIDIPKISQGQKATVTIDSLGEKTFTGHVLTVDRIGTVSSNVTNYPVTIELDTQTNEILPNMAATANIIIESKNEALMVPTSAVQSQSGVSTVRIMQNGNVAETTVETGIQSDTQIEIISGLSEGDTVVTSMVTNSSQSTGTSVFSGTRGFGGGFSGPQVRVGG